MNYYPSPEEICKYDAQTQTLKGNIYSKAREFIQQKCIREMKDQWDKHEGFVCKKIQGYNNTDYDLKKNHIGEWTCNCQHYVKEKTVCSHLLALFLYFKQTNPEQDYGVE